MLGVRYESINFGNETSLSHTKCVMPSPESQGSQRVPRPGSPSSACHARVFEGVAKSQFSPQGSCFQKWKACPGTLLNEFTPSNTLAWREKTRAAQAEERERGCPQSGQRNRCRRGPCTTLSQKTSSKTRFLKSSPLQIRQLILYSPHKLTNL